MSVSANAWLRQLNGSGLTREKRQDLLRQLPQRLDRASRYFPEVPEGYISRVRELLLSALFPQQGPLLLSLSPGETEQLSRAQAWEILRSELHALNGAGKPSDELHELLVDIVSMLSKNEFPLPARPRWAVDLFGWVHSGVALKMQACNLTLTIPTTVSDVGRAFTSAVLRNLGKYKRRWIRQWHKIGSNDEEEVLDDQGEALIPPGGDHLVPLCPTELAAHKLQLYLDLPTSLGTPKRERGQDGDSIEDKASTRPEWDSPPGIQETFRPMEWVRI